MIIVILSSSFEVPSLWEYVLYHPWIWYVWRLSYTINHLYPCISIYHDLHITTSIDTYLYHYIFILLIMIFILRSSFIIIYIYLYHTKYHTNIILYIYIIPDLYILYHIFGDLIISFFTKKNIWGRPRRRLLRVAVASVAVALGLVALLCPDRERNGTGKMRRDKGGIFQWFSHEFNGF